MPTQLVLMHLVGSFGLIISELPQLQHSCVSELNLGVSAGQLMSLQRLSERSRQRVLLQTSHLPVAWLQTSALARLQTRQLTVLLTTSLLPRHSSQAPVSMLKISLSWQTVQASVPRLQRLPAGQPKHSCWSSLTKGVAGGQLVRLQVAARLKSLTLQSLLVVEPQYQPPAARLFLKKLRLRSTRPVGCWSGVRVRAQQSPSRVWLMSWKQEWVRSSILSMSETMNAQSPQVVQQRLTSFSLPSVQARQRLISVRLNWERRGQVRVCGLMSSLNLRRERCRALKPELISLHFWMMKANLLLSLRLSVREMQSTWLLICVNCYSNSTASMSLALAYWEWREKRSWWRATQTEKHSKSSVLLVSIPPIFYLNHKPYCQPWIRILYPSSSLRLDTIIAWHTKAPLIIG